MKNLKINFRTLALIFVLVITANEVCSQSYSLKQPVMVPFYRGTIVSNTSIDIFWDVSEINNDNTKQDLALGLSQFGYTPFPFAEYNYVVGNWYKNLNDSNFNEENPNIRFINQSSNAITGLIFAKLSSDPGVNKELVVTRGDGKIYKFDNSGGAISTTESQTIYTSNGTVEAVGNFTNDNNEDIAIISGGDVKIYKSLGNGSLDTNAAYTLSGVSANKVLLSQISSYIYPHSVINGTTSNKDEIIIRTGTNIKIYLNDNSNGTSTVTTINGLDQFTEFKTADVNNDGLNDLITTSYADGIKIFLNSSGIISISAFYTNNAYNNSRIIESADFDKDGWNDIVITTQDSLKIFLNSYGSFSQTPSYSLLSNLTYLKGIKLLVKDLQNEGGLSVLFSGTLDINAPSNPYYPNEAPYDDEDLIRFNPVTSDAVPAPPIQFRSIIYKNGFYRPRLYLYNRGDRDFNKFRIYKRTARLPDSLVYMGETTSNSFIDTTEYIIINNSEPSNPVYNCFYFSTCTDFTSHESIHSDTAEYQVGDDPVYESYEEGDAFINGNEITNISRIENYQISNFPNPFNPTTKIYYTIPKEGNVKITIYNSIGKEVKVLVNEFKGIGSYISNFDGSNLSSGIYFYRIEAGSFIQTKRMILLK
ncbi:MAG TPA: FG-GAP-like repeat-containing protein [Ignavibacteria bacterium]|nr:FG-GAP-like repeat-containing protein [Ignavibacteria bacterium]HMR42093.1 FG-GAP-like repeat-containing protein [Ignavibacteria bacterium]